jgi:hypothetical protein
VATVFYDRTNNAGGGTYYDRTNDASTGFASAFGDIASVSTSAPAATALGYTNVTLVAPLYTGPGSICDPAIFTTGSPAAGDTISYPTTSNFTVLPDGTIQCDINSGSYACFYTALDGSFTNFAFTVTLNATAYAYSALVTDSVVTVDGSAVGFFVGSASAALDTATSVTTDGVAAQSAPGDIATVTTSGPDGFAASAAFPADAQGPVGSVSALTVDGFATGSAIALVDIAVATSQYIQGVGNEFGRGDAMADMATANAITVDGKGRAQWGKVPKGSTIWTLVS